MTEEIYLVGIDPGFGGGLAIICQKADGTIIPSVFGIPLIKEISKSTKKKKNDYDVKGLVSILKSYEGKKVKVYLERVNAMPNQGVTSMFSFGEGFGIWRGIIGALGFELSLVSPMTWKKEWPDDLLKKVDKPDILKLKPAEVNRLSAADRKAHKEAKKAHKQEMDAAKKVSKDHARELAGKLYPELKKSFELKKDDGKAEALLIAEYLRRQLKCQNQTLNLDPLQKP